MSLPPRTAACLLASVVMLASSSLGPSVTLASPVAHLAPAKAVTEAHGGGRRDDTTAQPVALQRLPGDGRDRGFVSQRPGLLGHTPLGLQIWVDPEVQGRQMLVRNSRAAVRDFRRVGIRARFRGLGAPPPREGVAVVTVSPAGCRGYGGPGSSLGVARTWYGSLPAGQSYVQRGRVLICPRLFGLEPWQGTATVRHELGHVMGLGHYDRLYRGGAQVMAAFMSNDGTSTYQQGDLNGLRYFAGNNELVRSLFPPEGALEASDWNGGTIRFTGWAVLRYYQSRLVQIEVTYNGKQLTTVPTNVHRPDVNQSYDLGSRRPHGFAVTVPTTGGDHEYCFTAVSPVNRVARAPLGCASFSS